MRAPTEKNNRIALNTLPMKCSQLIRHEATLAPIANEVADANVFFGMSTTANKRDHMVEFKLLRWQDRLPADIAPASIPLEDARVIHFANARHALACPTSANVLPIAYWVILAPPLFSKGPRLFMRVVVCPTANKNALTVAQIPPSRSSAYQFAVDSVVGVTVRAHFFFVGISVFLIACLAPNFMPICAVLVFSKFCEWFFFATNIAFSGTYRKETQRVSASAHLLVRRILPSLKVVTIFTSSSVSRATTQVFVKVCDGFFGVALFAYLGCDDANPGFAAAFLATWAITRFLITCSVESVKGLFLVTLGAAFRGGRKQGQLNSDLVVYCFHGIHPLIQGDCLGDSACYQHALSPFSFAHIIPQCGQGGN